MAAPKSLHVKGTQAKADLEWPEEDHREELELKSNEEFYKQLPLRLLELVGETSWFQVKSKISVNSTKLQLADP